MCRLSSFVGFGCALALSIWGGVAGSAAASRDWKAHPAVVELDTSADIFAIGDPHGDPQRLAGALAGAKLIDDAASPPDKVKWTGGKSILVVTGDLIDKWKDSLGVITLLRTLQSDAATHGGRVIITMGNHEAEISRGSARRQDERVQRRAEGRGPQSPGRRQLQRRPRPIPLPAADRGARQRLVLQPCRQHGQPDDQARSVRTSKPVLPRMDSQPRNWSARTPFSKLA